MFSDDIERSGYLEEKLLTPPDSLSKRLSHIQNFKLYLKKRDLERILIPQQFHGYFVILITLVWQIVFLYDYIYSQRIYIQRPYSQL